MANMQSTKTPISEQDPKVRARNFKEVCEGYTSEESMNEASRCLNCKNKPCVSGCPVGVRIPDFIAKVKDGEFEQAYKIITATNGLPAVCGRVCPQENQCEGKCVRGIKGEPVGIGRLERFCADYMANKEIKLTKAEPNRIKVAVIGSGPSGLTCAADLAKLGYSVTIFEAFHTAGGVLMYGIPEFRLPKATVQHEITNLKKLGVEIKTDMVIGKILSIDEIMDMGYKAVFVGTGAGLPNFMGIPGEGLVGVFSANEYLTRINLMKAYLDEYDPPVKHYNSFAVVGGAEHVYIIYRRSEAEMPARREEVHHAKEEGIEFVYLTNPVEITGDENGCVNGVKCQKMELGEPGADGRRSVKAIPDSEYVIPIDACIMSIGTSPNPLIRTTTPGLETNRRGCFVVDEGMLTTKEGVYAGGDAVTGAATVILAMGAGKTAAKSIDEYLKTKGEA